MTVISGRGGIKIVQRASTLSMPAGLSCHLNRRSEISSHVARTVQYRFEVSQIPAGPNLL